MAAFALSCLGLLAGVDARAQSAEVQFVQSWQPQEGKPLAEVSGLVLTPEGAALVAERGTGSVWRIGADGAAGTELAARGGAFSSRKLGGVALLGRGRIAVANTSNDRVALLDEQRRAVRVFGNAGRGDGELKDPEGLAFSMQQRLYVADRGNNRVAVYSEDGVFLAAIGGTRDPASALVNPWQVAVDRAERVYVLEDSGAGRLSVYTHAGKLLKRLTAESFPGARAARWRALAVAPDGRAFVADRDNGNVVELDWERGSVRRRFGSPGTGRGQFAEIAAMSVAGQQLAIADAGNRKIEIFRIADIQAAGAPGERLPSVRRAATRAIECERALLLDGGDVLCLDRARSRLTRLDASGKVRLESDARIDRPQRIAADARDIAVADGNTVKIFGHDGKLRFTIGRSGSRDGEFDDIGGIHLADHIYVADVGNRRVQIFTRDGIFVSKLGEADSQKLGMGALRLGRPVAVVTDALNNLYIADAASKMVHAFSPRREWRYALTGVPYFYDSIYGLAADDDNRLYVFASTERASQVVDVFHGMHREITFAAFQGPQAVPARVANLSLSRAGHELALYDTERKELSVYHYLRLAQRVAGVEIRGEPAGVRVTWRRAPERFVAGYRVYGAAQSEGPYERLLETRDAAAPLGADAARRMLFYRVSAYTNFDVEGEPSAPAEDVFRTGYRHFEAGRHEQALAVLARVAKSAPDHAAAVEYLGRSLLALGRHDAALAQFQELARRPGYETVGRRLEADTLAASGDTLGARAAIERAIVAGQVDAAGYALCGELGLKLGDAAGAVRCLDAALAREPANALARAALGEALIRIGATDKGIAQLDAAAAAAPADPAPLRRAGRILQEVGRHREALARYTRLLALAPGDVEALIASANAHLAFGELDQARTIALSLAAHPAQEGFGQYVLGRIAVSQGQHDNAIVALTRATRLNPRHVEAWAGLGEAYLGLKDDHKAHQAFRRAAALAGAGADVHRRLAEIEARAGRHAAAFAALEHAVALAPTDAGLRLAQARSLAALQRWKESGNAAREALRLAPKSFDALLLAGEAAHRQGKNGEAIESLKQAVALNPDSYDAHFRLGRSYAENNLYAEAQKFLERAARLDERNDAPHLVMAGMFLERRSFDAAIAALTLAVGLNASEANRRQLDEAYELRKKSQTTTGPRLALEDLRLSRVFAAAHKQYATEPVGLVRIRNDTAEDVRGLRLSFFLKEYMDFPAMREIAELKANSTVEVPLHATFNNKVLGIDEDTRVLAVVTLSAGGSREGALEVTQSLTLYGKNAIVWSNGDMVGSFVTPRDDTLRNFVREAVNRYAPPPQGALNRPLALAATVYNSLAALGLRYQVDPNSPYSRIGPDQVDYVQFPRETLRLKSGDCDDLSVLIAAAYENLGVEAALVEVPGHLFLMFRTGLKAPERGFISLQDDLLVIRDGEIWIPLEATLISTSFSEAWAEGARRYREAAAANQVKVVSLRQAWERFPPASLAPASYSAEVPSGERVARLIEREHRLLLARRLEREVLAYRQTLEADPKNVDARLQIGTLYARAGVTEVALREFDAIIAQEPRHAAAHNNRGNLFYGRGDYERALDAYRFAEELDPADGGIRINSALAYYRLGRLQEAQTKFREALKLQKDLASQYRAFVKLLGN